MELSGMSEIISRLKACKKEVHACRVRLGHAEEEWDKVAKGCEFSRDAHEDDCYWCTNPFVDVLDQYCYSDNCPLINS